MIREWWFRFVGWLVDLVPIDDADVIEEVQRRAFERLVVEARSLADGEVWYEALIVIDGERTTAYAHSITEAIAKVMCRATVEASS